MIKIILALLFAIIFLSCSNKPPTDSKQWVNFTFANANGGGISTVYVYRIGNCQYLGDAIGMGLNRSFLTHKGDCDNPIHKCNCK